MNLKIETFQHNRWKTMVWADLDKEISIRNFQGVIKRYPEAEKVRISLITPTQITELIEYNKERSILAVPKIFRHGCHTDEDLMRQCGCEICEWNLKYLESAAIEIKEMDFDPEIHLEVR